MHKGTGGAPIRCPHYTYELRTNHRENSRHAIKILGGLVRNRCRPLGHAHRTMGVQDPLCNTAATETSGTGDHIPQGVLEVVVSKPVSARAAEQGSDRASSTLPRLLQPLVSCSQGNRGVEADHRSVLPQCLRALPELHYGDALFNPQGPSTGPVVKFPRPERRLLSYRDRPSRQTLLALLSQRHCLAVHSTAKYLPRKPVLAFVHLHWVKLHMYLDEWLLNPGTHQEALEQTSWLKSLCQKLGLVLNLESWI